MHAKTDEKSGAVPSFDAWVAARGPALIGFAYLVTADRARAEEAVQDALSRAYGKWARVCRGRDPEPYVRRMIVNGDISGWRRFGKRERPVAEVIPAAAASGHDLAQTVTEEDAMWRLCAGLPRRQRAAVVLRYYEDLPDAQIAAILDCSESTVRSQIHRALATIRTHLTEEAAMADHIDTDDPVVTLLQRTLAGRATEAMPRADLAAVARAKRRRRVALRSGLAGAGALGVAVAIAVPTMLVMGLYAVFGSARGGPVGRSTFAHTWRVAVRVAGAPTGTGFHALRHFYASLLIRHGESVKTVQARLGHASASETLDTYSHLWPDSDDRTREAIDAVLGDTERVTSESR